MFLRLSHGFSPFPSQARVPPAPGGLLGPGASGSLCSERGSSGSSVGAGPRRPCLLRGGSWLPGCPPSRNAACRHAHWRRPSCQIAALCPVREGQGEGCGRSRAHGTPGALPAWTSVPGAQPWACDRLDITPRTARLLPSGQQLPPGDPKEFSPLSSCPGTVGGRALPPALQHAVCLMQRTPPPPSKDCPGPLPCRPEFLLPFTTGLLERTQIFNTDACWGAQNRIKGMVTTTRCPHQP